MNIKAALIDENEVTPASHERPSVYFSREYATIALRQAKKSLFPISGLSR